MIKAYSDGIPANGNAVPDGAMMAKVRMGDEARTTAALRRNRSRSAHRGVVLGEGLEAIPGTNGWGYATFRHDAASGTWKPFGDNPAFANTCHACHTRVKARDFVFTGYGQR